MYDVTPFYRLLEKLEAEMRRQGLWEVESPPEEALNSVIPFCYDTLEFTQWLQWIFIPRTRSIMQRGLPLPAKSGIAPLAEMSFAEMERVDPRPLLDLITEFDRLINSA